MMEIFVYLLFVGLFLFPFTPHHHLSLRAELPDFFPLLFPFPLPHPAHHHCPPLLSSLCPAILYQRCVVHWAVAQQLILYEKLFIQIQTFSLHCVYIRVLTHNVYCFLSSGYTHGRMVPIFCKILLLL